MQILPLALVLKYKGVLKSVFMKKTFAIQTFAIDVLLILLSYGVFLLVF